MEEVIGLSSYNQCKAVEPTVMLMLMLILLMPIAIPMLMPLVFLFSSSSSSSAVVAAAAAAGAGRRVMLASLIGVPSLNISHLIQIVAEGGVLLAWDNTVNDAELTAQDKRCTGSFVLAVMVLCWWHWPRWW